MTSVQQGLQRLMQGLKQAGIEPAVAPASPADLAAVAEWIPLSPELTAWYSQAAPMEEIAFEWGALQLTLHSLPGLVEWQEGWRWQAGRRDRLDPEWQPEWVVIANWDGDPAIADTAKPETPVFQAPHGMGGWDLCPIAPNLGAFLAAVGIWAEIVHGQFHGDIKDADYNMRDDVHQALDKALEPILAPGYRDRWTRFD